MTRARRLSLQILCAMLVAWPLLCEPANAQTPGQNVNMVSGLKWPGGDPFLQRQNEPSLAVSSRNERHLLAGANDYRSVDVPFPDVIPGPMAGDAWLGVFKSFDGGQTWQSTLLPGYPQDASPEGLASPLHGFTTAADPTVRAGTHGLFYYSGIAFNRGTNQGVVFVARFMDLANKENGDVPESTDPIKYLGAVAVDSGTSGQFIDKPWLAVDIPRAGAPTCMIPVSPTQSIPAGMAYLVWSRFTGSSSTKIMISHSHDCGTTWSTPIKLSESNAVNQGTVAAVDPVSGAVYVAWRRFASSSEPNAIVSVKSTNFGKTFTKATEVATIVPFDQGTTSGSFRTNALPTMAVSVDSSGQSRVHIAWADRGVPDGDARIRMTTSTDGLNWPAPVVVDGGPISDDADNSFTRGHQFMPALTFTGGKLMLLYYDSRLDHTVSLFRPNDGTIVPGCEFFCPDAQGDFYQVYQDPRGELPANPELVFTPFITDAGLNLRRHTLELRVAQSDPGNAPNFNYAMVSQYRFGTIPGQVENYLQQLQVEPPNFPMFQNGSVPFIGDYIDIAGQMFLPNPDGTWRFNTAPQTAPVHYAVWTSNRDVRPPTDGNWAAWTPPIYPFGGPMSIFDPSQPRPTCSMNREGMRNQNIYSSRITQGLVVTVPQNAKPLSPALKRAFVVLVKNDTNLEKHFRLAIANQPPGGHASFLPDNDSIHELDVSVAAHSGISRTVLATSSNPAAQITVNVNETFAPYGAINPSGLSSFVVLNGDATIPELVNPDGVDPNDPDQNIQNVEIYTPNISNPNISNPNISNPNISNPNISNPNISNPNISNPNISNPNISNPNISNPNISNPNISNPNISNPNISNTTLTDATYEVVNAGNTTTGYTVQLIGNTPTGSTLQLLVNRPYLTPVSVNCTVQQEVSYELLASVINPVINDPTQVQNPNLLDPRTTNATFWLRPGERALITLRGLLDCSTEEECRAAMTALTNQLGPDVVAQPQNEDNTHSFAMPLIITTNSPLDPSAKAGVLYSKTLAAFGGKPGYTWSLVSAVPDGLTLDANTGVISGTPLEAGDFTFTVKVVDSGTPQRETEKEFTLTVSKSATTTVVLSTAPNPSVVGEMVTVNYSVTINAPGSGTPTGTVNVSDGEGDTCSNPASAGSCAITLTSAGPKILTATFQANSAFEESSATTTHDVNAASTTTTITSNLSAATVVGQPYNVSVTVTPNAPGRGTPTGAVTVSDGAETCAITLAGGAGSCSLTSTTAGTKNVTAAYAGSADFSASTSAGVSHPVNPAATTTTITSDLSAATVVGQAYSVAVTVATNAPGSGVPTGVVTVSDGAETCIITLAGGAGSCNLTSTTSGLKNVTAAYAGAADFNASTSAGVSHTVNPAATTTTITSDLSAATVVGEAYSVAVNVASNAPGSGTPTGAVMVSDGAETCTITLASGVGSCNLTSTTAGLKSVTATYDVGDADKNYDTSTSAAVSHPVNATQATVVINTAGLETTPTVVGEPITVSIGVNGVSGAPLPTGTLVVSLEDGSAEPCTAALVDGQASCSITPLSAGPLKVIVAVYDSSGDPNYLDASATVTHDVNPAATSLTITSTSPSPSVVGQAVTVSYELSVTPPATGTPTPTGTVTVNADGLSCSGPAPAGSCSITFSTTGTKSLTATYDLGDTDKNYLGSTSAAFSHDVQPGSTTTAITAVSPATSVTGQSITVSFSASVVAPANGTLAGTVTVNDGTGASCSATLATGSCTLAPTSAGTKTLTASFVPSGTNFTGSSGTASHTVGKAGTTTTIAGDTPDPSETGQAVTVSWNVTVASPGSGTPTGTVTVNATGGLSCTGAAPSGSCTITFNTAGAKAITATYNGDANYLASTSAETAHEVKKPPYAFNGFLTPLSTAGTFDSPSFSGTFNKGKAIPIKWQLKNASGNFVTSLSSLTRMEAVFNSDCVGAPDGASVLLYSPTSGATGGSTFRYDTGNNQFVFNWDTSSVSPTGAGCYTLVVRLDEGTVRATNVKLR